MRLLSLLALAALLLLCACASSYHSVEVRVLSKDGGGIVNAVVENEETCRVTDAAGRVILEDDDAEAHHWRIRAEGYEPLTVDASPNAIRLKRADGKLPAHADSIPLVFVLERKNAASDPKAFESKAK